MPKISLKKALSLFFEQWLYPVITNYHLGIFVFSMYREKKYLGKPLDLNKTLPEKKDYNRLLFDCLENGILNENKDFPEKSVFNILGRTHSTAEDIICTVNPFAYLSHLSAMDYHGLTDRIPKTLFFSTPAPRNWRQFAEERMKKELGQDFFEYTEGKFPPLRLISINKVKRRPVHFYSSSHLGAYKNVKDRPLRVSTIGKTFLDMLRAPDLCGGIEHVIDVFSQHSEPYLDLIVQEISRHGKPIDQIRAGYILDEILGLQHSEIANWQNQVQRGGSRKLDPSEEYAPVYSTKWGISINAADRETD